MSQETIPRIAMGWFRTPALLGVHNAVEDTPPAGCRRMARTRACWGLYAVDADTTHTIHAGLSHIEGEPTSMGCAW